YARVLDSGGGVPDGRAYSFCGVAFRARQVWSGSVGVHFRLWDSFTISPGSCVVFSPVDPATPVFRRVDVIGFRAGVSFRIDKLSMSVGAGWEHGTGSDDLVPGTLPLPGEKSELTLNTFTLLFSVSFKF